MGSSEVLAGKDGRSGGHPWPATRATAGHTTHKSRPLVEAKPWLEAEFNRIPPRGDVADAIRYALTRWNALSHFLDYGRIEIDNNTVERAIRALSLGRKNHPPGPMAGPHAGRPSPRCWPRQSSMMWSRSPI
jgi:hypothetical protein